MNLEEKTKEYVDYAKKVIEKRALIPEEGYQKSTIEAMNYSVSSGGKRLRPVFMKAFFDLYEGQGIIIEYFMSALELIHTFSLVHDDLPALDNDMFRRGKKTTHAVYGEAMAILCGDGLLNRAYELAIEGCLACDEKDRIYGLRALQLLSEKTGIYGMIGGESYDVETEKKKIVPDDKSIDFIFRLKTCALIEAAFTVGAILAKAPKEDIEIIERAGYCTGMAFQIIDDILDVTGDEEILGKPVGSDEKNQKTTYVTLHGLEGAVKDADSYSREAVKALKSLGRDTEYLEELILSLTKRNK
ncbi:MAG: polyprenyl synthetase family protein [Lachnospiraceae bacterium]|nr:polyprenyl synthetase family protein [Lachnospiraceae bacterium]